MKPQEPNAGLLAPGYEVRRLLGAGAYGAVYEALQTSTGRTVALKVLAAGLSSDRDRRRFLDEVSTLARLDSHPHVVDLLEFGLLGDGRPFFAMRFSADGSLQTELARGPLGVERLLDVGIGAASGLAAAHAIEVIHRDIKPANILLSASHGPLVADFGISVAQESARMATSAHTDAYAAPEVLDATAYSEKSDQFAFGVMLYELIAGRRPFTAASLGRLADEIRYQPAPPLADDVPASLRAVIDTTMAKDPADRFESIASVAAALHDVQVELGLAPTTIPAWSPPSRESWAQVNPDIDEELPTRYARAEPPEAATRQSRPGSPSPARPLVAVGLVSSEPDGEALTRAARRPVAKKPRHGRQVAAVLVLSTAALLLGAVTVSAVMRNSASDSPGATGAIPSITSSASSPIASARDAQTALAAPGAQGVATTPGAPVPSPTRRAASPASAPASSSATGPGTLPVAAPGPTGSTPKAAKPPASTPTTHPPTASPSPSRSTPPPASLLQKPVIVSLVKSGSYMRLVFTQAPGGGVTHFVVRLGNVDTGQLMNSINLDYNVGQSTYTVSFPITVYFCNPPTTRVEATVQAVAASGTSRTSGTSAAASPC